MGKMKIKIMIFLCSLFLFSQTVTATELSEAEKARQQEEAEETLLSEFDFDGIDRELKKLLPGEKMNFLETVKSLISGETEISVKLLGSLISDQLFYEFKYNRKALVHIMLIAVFAAVFTNFSNAFQSRQISEISFYMLYLLLITVCLNSFQVVLSDIGEKLTALTDFMRVLGPAYFLAVAISSGGGSAVVFYNLVLFLIYLVEMLVLNFILPLIHVYIVMKVLNELSAEEYLSKFAELIETSVTWIMKTLLTAVIGLNVVQGLISPVLDSLKRSVFTKGAEAIPVIGDALGGATEVVLGTAVLIKNGIGVAGAVVCIGICAAPVIQMAVMTFFYKLVAALLQPVSDKRIVGCIGSIGDGGQILIRVIFTVGLLFLLTIAVVAATTT